MEGKLAELQDALTSEENKSKQEHRQRMKLEQTLADLEAKLEREMNVSQLAVRRKDGATSLHENA